MLSRRATIRVRAETKADVTLNQFLNFPGGVYAIKPSTDYLNTNTLAWITTCFPRQFPFGRGGPDEGRSRKISDKALLNHYLRVSSGVFQDYEFCLHAYDYLSRKNTRGQAGVQARMPFGSITKGESWAGLDDAQIQRAADYSTLCTKAAKRGRPYPPSDHLDPRAQ